MKTPITMPGDIFVNCDKVHRISSPVFVVHGMKDEIVPFHHGKKLFDKCSSGVEHLWLKNAGHNDIEKKHGKQLFQRLHSFIHKLSVEYLPEKARLSHKTQPLKTRDVSL